MGVMLAFAPRLTVLQIGDFGALNIETGKWGAEGSIFDFPDLCRGVVVKHDEPQNEYRKCSEGAKIAGLGVDASA